MNRIKVSFEHVNACRLCTWRDLLLSLVVAFRVSDAKDKEGLLLCSSRGLLKKMKIRPLVGDFVQVAKVDWVERRAVVNNILTRQRESIDPPVANFTQLLTVFALTTTGPGHVSGMFAMWNIHVMDQSLPVDVSWLLPATM